MDKLKYLFVIVIVIIPEISGDIPGCEYFDTVNITNAQNSNGTYIYENIIIPEDKIGIYNYTILSDGTRKDVDYHPRGCICQLKTCVRFCCDPLETLVYKKAECHGRLEKYDGMLNVTRLNGTTVLMDIFKDVVIQDFGIPCETHYNYDETDNWILYENGLLYHEYQGKNVEKPEYCLQPVLINDDMVKILPHQCREPESSFNDYFLLVCIICMLLNIVLYLVLPNLKRRYSDQFYILYFICLTISFILSRLDSYFENLYDEEIPCYLIACFGYYFVMASFLWLLVVNYNLWISVNKLSGKHVTFVLGNIFVWTAAAFLLFIAFLIHQYYETLFCLNMSWINADTLLGGLVLNVPISIILLINIILCCAVSKVIYDRLREVASTVSKKERQCHASFKLFATRFLICGVLWVLEIIARYTNINDTAQLLADCLIESQFIMLFIHSILGKQERKFICRWLGLKKKNDYDTAETEEQYSF